MITLQKLTTLESRVTYCLENFPHTRNSDIDLFASLCENFYPPFERPLYNWRDLAHAMHQVPSLDHIARCRRKAIQKTKYTKYLPTVSTIAEARNISKETWIKYATTHNINEPKRSNIPEGYDDEGNIK